jgi:hypothetical protein
MRLSFVRAGLAGVGVMLLSVAVPVVAVPAVPPEMTVATFLQRADRARAFGPRAFMTPDYAVLKAEVERVARRYTAEVKAARAAGRSPHSCLPPNPDLTPDHLVTHMRTIPPVQRPKTTVRTAVYSLLKKRYPCRV